MDKRPGFSMVYISYVTTRHTSANLYLIYPWLHVLQYVCRQQLKQVTCSGYFEDII